MSRCAAEMCPNWTGDGCICEVMGLTPARLCMECGLVSCRPGEVVCVDCKDEA